MINQVFSKLYEAVVDECDIESKGNASKAGHEFEDRIVGVLSRFVPVSNVKARCTLSYPTLSGLEKHQFDCVFTINNLTYVIECKKQKKKASKNQIYYFNSTITDHALGMKADGVNREIRSIFLSTTDFDYASAIYAVLNGIRVITPKRPPPEYLVDQIDSGSDMFRRVSSIIKMMPEKNPLFLSKIKRLERTPAYVYKLYIATLAEYNNR